MDVNPLPHHIFASSNFKLLFSPRGQGIQSNRKVPDPQTLYKKETIWTFLFFGYISKPLLVPQVTWGHFTIHHNHFSISIFVPSNFFVLYKSLQFYGSTIFLVISTLQRAKSPDFLEKYVRGQGHSREFIVQLASTSLATFEICQLLPGGEY